MQFNVLIMKNLVFWNGENLKHYTVFLTASSIKKAFALSVKAFWNKDIIATFLPLWIQTVCILLLQRSSNSKLILL